MLKKIANSPVLLSILMIVGGIILVVWPSPVLSTVITLVGIGLIVGGLISVIGWFREKEKSIVSYSRLGAGLLAVIGGILIATQPLKVASLFPMLIGAVILVTGIINLLQSLDLRNMGYSGWLVTFILALITIIGGILLITQPISALEIPVIAAGIILIYDGIVSLWIATRVVKA